MFVKSKTGEIDRRVSQCQNIVNSIAEKDQQSDNTTTSRKSRKSLVLRLRQEVVLLTRGVQHLARFIGVQRTGFRKLLKKYKKWSGSTDLSSRFLPILEDPASFTNQDFTSTFLELSLLYNVLRQAKLTTVSATPDAAYPDNENLCMFDCEMATSVSKSCTFWVHPDNVVEIKIFLLQHLSLVSDDATITTTTSNSSANEPNRPELTYVTYLDNPKKFNSIQTSTEPGQIRSVHGAVASTPILCSPVGGLRHFCIASLSNEQADLVLSSKFDALAPSLKEMSNISKMAVSWVQKRQATAISKAEFRRTRFRKTVEPVAGVNDEVNKDGTPSGLLDKPDIWAVIDSDIKFAREAAANMDWQDSDVQDLVEFPHSLLEVRWKGLDKPTWVSDLEKSHLVHQVKGFSLYAHSVAVFYPESLSVLPNWLTLIEEKIDIRKTPAKQRPTVKRDNSAGTGAPAATAAGTLNTYGGPVSPSMLLNLDTDRLLSSVPKLDYGSSSEYSSDSQQSPTDHPKVRYWNEFDDPEDGDAGIFIVIPQEDMDDGLFNEDNVAFLFSVGENIASKAGAVKHKLLSLFGLDSETNTSNNQPRGLSTIYEEDEEAEDDDDDFEGYYSFSRIKPPGSYVNYRGSTIYYSPIAQRNRILCVLYTTCFFISSFLVVTLFGVITGEDISSISAVTCAFMTCVLVIAVCISVLGLCLFLMRVEEDGDDVPAGCGGQHQEYEEEEDGRGGVVARWHEGLVYSIFFAVVCGGIAEIAWILSI